MSKPAKVAKYRVYLSAEERLDLLAKIKKGSQKSSVVLHSQILLAIDESELGAKWLVEQTMEAYHCSAKTIERVRKRFCEEGMGIFDTKVRKTRADKIFDARVEAHLIAILCEERPEGAPKWELKLLADKLVSLGVVETISTTSVRTLLKKTNLSLFTKSNM